VAEEQKYIANLTYLIIKALSFSSFPPSTIVATNQPLFPFTGNSGYSLSSLFLSSFSSLSFYPSLLILFILPFLKLAEFSLRTEQ
jgi:hypothetical protein